MAEEEASVGRLRRRIDNLENQNSRLEEELQIKSIRLDTLSRINTEVHQILHQLNLVLENCRISMARELKEKDEKISQLTSNGFSEMYWAGDVARKLQKECLKQEKELEALKARLGEPTQVVHEVIYF